MSASLKTFGIVERAADELRAMVLDGRIKDDETLKQTDLARRLGISRTPLRLALQRLVREGLISARHHRSARVVSMSPGYARDLFDMRAALEPIALGSAFPRFDKVRLAMAEQCLDAASTAVRHLDLAAANWRFHQALYVPCERPMLLEAIADLHIRVTRAVMIGLSVQSRRQSSHDEHVAILAACRDGDKAKAIRLLTKHLLRAGAAAQDAIKSQERRHASP